MLCLVCKMLQHKKNLIRISQTGIFNSSVQMLGLLADYLPFWGDQLKIYVN